MNETSGSTQQNGNEVVRSSGEPGAAHGDVSNQNLNWWIGRMYRQFEELKLKE